MAQGLLGSYSTMEPLPSILPVLPIRNAVLFPAVSMPLVVGRGRSIRALEEAQLNDSLLIVVAQRVLTQGGPQTEDLYTIGTLCKVENATITDTGSRQIVVTGVARYKIAEFQF